MDILKCHKCFYEWETKSKFKLISCPCCGAKVKNTNWSDTHE